MTLDDIKTKRLSSLAAKYAPPAPLTVTAQYEQDENGAFQFVNGSLTSNGATNLTTTANTLTLSGDLAVEGVLQIEGKQRQVPEFVRHCVTAITSKPETLSRVQQKKDGSPFGICYASYKKNKRSLAAKHSKGKHHTDKQYEKSLATLRKECEDLRAKRPSRRQVVFEAVEQTTHDRRRGIRFELRG